METITKSFIEKRIKERAVKYFNRDLEEFDNFLRKNSIGKNLRIKINGENLTIRDNYRESDGIVSKYDDKGVKSNFIEARNKIIEEYEKEETDSILRSLQGLENYLNSNL